MRIVLQGTPGNLYVPTAADLPADRDLRQSFFRYVNISGRNLSLYNLQDVDILDSVATNVRLPGSQRTDYLMSRRVNWSGAIIPSDISSYNHDLVVESYRQLSAFHPVLSRVIARVSSSYINSWRDSIFDVMQSLNITKEQARDQYIAVVGNSRPRLTKRLRDHVRNGDIKDTPPNTVRPINAYPTSDGQTLDLSAIPLGLDRYAAARLLESQFSEYWFYVGQLDPHPIIITLRRNRLDGTPPWDWFKNAWPS